MWDRRSPGTNVVVELLGYRFHRTKHELQRDSERYHALMLEGLCPFQFTYDDVVTGADRLLTTLQLAVGRSVSAQTTGGRMW